MYANNLQISFLPDNAAADMKQERAKVLVAIVRNNNIKFAMHKLTSINNYCKRFSAWQIPKISIFSISIQSFQNLLASFLVSIFILIIFQNWIFH